jgi:hypothetical protein
MTIDARELDKMACWPLQRNEKYKGSQATESTRSIQILKYPPVHFTVLSGS